MLSIFKVIMSITNTRKYASIAIFSFILLGCNEQAEHNQKSVQALHVDVLPLSYTTLRLTTELPGRITAFKEVEVRPQITGILKKWLIKKAVMLKLVIYYLRLNQPVTNHQLIVRKLS